MFVKSCILSIRTIKIKYFAVLIATIMISACGYIPIHTPFIISEDNYEKKTFDTDTIRVLCWNVYKENNETDSKDEFKTIILNKKPNIVLLQEFIHNDSISKFFEKDFKLGYEFAANTYIKKYKEQLSKISKKTWKMHV